MIRPFAGMVLSKAMNILIGNADTLLQIAHENLWNPDDDFYDVGAEALFRLIEQKFETIDDFFPWLHSHHHNLWKYKLL
jgi:hypothetical protein